MALPTVEGIYENGAVRLIGEPPPVQSAAVLVTFLAGAAPLELEKLGISPAQANDLRARLKTFSADWERTEMDAYDAL